MVQSSFQLKRQELALVENFCKSSTNAFQKTTHSTRFFTEHKYNSVMWKTLSPGEILFRIDSHVFASEE